MSMRYVLSPCAVVYLLGLEVGGIQTSFCLSAGWLRWPSFKSFCFLFFFQVECIMSILIYKNLMKGYFAHKSKVVVLSKQDPFPKLNGKPVNS